ncbi:MAG: class I SAM-dependent methyltransferase [Nitrospirota bacterium]|nr:class I SAM-dependent methyltransferase [Nitrospirota bacterium]
MANRLIEPGLRKGRLLDIGCGEHPLFLLTTEFSERFGLDQIVDPRAIEPFQQAGLTLINHDLHRDEWLPFENERFSVVTMLAVVEHLEERKAMALAREILRVLKPGGTYVLTTPAAWSDRLLRVLASLRLVSPIEIQEHKAAYTPASLRELLKSAGFHPAGVRTGYFELYLNLWATARKPAGTAQ